MDPYQPDQAAPPQQQFSQQQALYAANGGHDQTMSGMEVDQPSSAGTHVTADYRPQTSQSDGFPVPSGAFSPPAEQDKFPSPTTQFQQQPNQASRPPSSMSGAPGSQQAQQEQKSSNQQETRTQNSVVIKVGMVGDAQIGKTSLMVKYVEGSWDEDYIQTLGR